MIDWSVVMGLGFGLGMPAIGGLAFLMRMENRVTQLESNRIDDQRWRIDVTSTLSAIARDVNRLIGGNASAQREKLRTE